MDKTYTEKPTKRQAVRQRHPFKWALLKTSEAISYTAAVQRFLFPQVVSLALMLFKKGPKGATSTEPVIVGKVTCEAPTVLFICWNRTSWAPLLLSRHWWMIQAGSPGNVSSFPVSTGRWLNTNFTQLHFKNGQRGRQIEGNTLNLKHLLLTETSPQRCHHSGCSRVHSSMHWGHSWPSSSSTSARERI